ncbi:arsenate reductase (glutaredoxin) [Sulfurovum sp.]|jgi:arsenate reductase|uniref:arsenate reductase (glutaredoxin) n=1 Tax=Sulfurovum sp. TaxID=1969726 RepID=UPI002A359924|nr:arsenate reductase (glutaredoxin) [Sulfurovum sp.]MDD3499439.1 arsenate reductase (glutaredoxin) [Sulfurovum sp.]MDY0402963.1 arsenate reductase (glutaredoxin) [Sulfurovum sp.]
MANVTIWHNPKCSKSRDSFKLLEERGIDAEVIKYLDTPPTKEEIKEVLRMLGIAPRELMRTKEALYKELHLDEEMDDEKLIEAMVSNPRLIERPVVIKEGKAVIGRPLEKVVELIS